jgi:hypothetical protein
MGDALWNARIATPQSSPTPNSVKSAVINSNKPFALVVTRLSNLVIIIVEIVVLICEEQVRQYQRDVLDQKGAPPFG